MAARAPHLSDALPRDTEKIYRGIEDFTPIEKLVAFNRGWESSLPFPLLLFAGGDSGDMFGFPKQDTRSDVEINENQQNTLRVTGGTSESIHVDMIRLAFESRARLAIVPMQDFLGLGSEARLNTPGTTQNNWRWRVSEDQLSAHFCQSVANLVEEAARA